MVSKSATIMNSDLEYMTCDITLVGVGGEIWTDRNHKISGLIPPSCIMSCDITLDCEMWHHPWWGWEGWTDGGYSWQVVGVTVKPPTFTFFSFETYLRFRLDFLRLSWTNFEFNCLFPSCYECRLEKACCILWICRVHYFWLVPCFRSSRQFQRVLGLISV